MGASSSHSLLPANLRPHQAARRTIAKAIVRLIRQRSSVINREDKWRG
jgi:hypothetical protein